MKRTIIAIAAIGVIALGIVGWKATHKPLMLLPPAIKSQLSFKAYVPTGDFTITPGTVQYDAQQSLMTIKIQKLGKPFAVLTEQPYPDTLIYDKLIGTMSAERQVGNSLGEATVTHPKASPGKEVVVVQADSTLMFASTDNKYSDSQWRSFLNSLEPSG